MRPQHSFYFRSYGRASVKAYSAYRKQIFLDFVISNWLFGRRYTLSQQDVSSRSTPIKSFPLSTVCGGCEGTITANTMR
ncbi:hypothetical protein C8J57DRAFT_1077708 [Mycena rebaudengoi]|nr:hypothetical protein C8J57DRAFT_1077708 [Mycena rebaudengoi]